MKRMLTLVLTLTMLLSLTACGTKPDTQNPSANKDTSNTEQTAWTPNKTINCIVPFGAGGGTDVMARAVAAAMDAPQGVVITNIEGGGSSIGAMEAYHANPDGYSIFCVGLEALIAGVLSGTYPESDSYEKFIPLCSAGDDAFIVTASKNSGFQSLEDLVSYATKNPGKVTCAGTGSMSITNAVTQLFFDACGIDVQYVPYDGASKNRAAVMGGHNDISVLLVSEAATCIDSDDVVPLCVLGSERSEFYPDVPCANEVGDYDIDVSFHRAFFCTPGTPEEIVQALDNMMKAACDNEKTKETLRSLYYSPNYIGSAELKELGDIRYQELGEIFDSLAK